MNVSDMMRKKHHNDIFMAACIMDKAGVQEIETTYQDAWDRGESSTILGPRKDDEAELEEFCKQMQSDLRNLIIKNWVNLYKREEIVSLCNLLLRGPQRQYTRIRLVSDLELDATDIVSEWNNCHEDEPKICYLNDTDIG